MIVEFGEYLPDQPDFKNAGSRMVKNVLPVGNSYKSFPGLNTYSDALDARCQGAISARDNDGNVYNFAGDAAKLYELSNTTWTDVPKGGGYSTANDENWYFTQWGEQIFATNFADAIQEYTMGTSSLFADLTASAPKARYIATIRDFVVVANTWDSTDGNQPNRVRWCAQGDPTDWTVSSTTQADFQNLDGKGGWCTQIVGGEYGIVFQERAIFRMEYIGSPIIFQFDEVESGKGTCAPGSVIKAGNIIFYLGQDGFYAFDGRRSIPIGANKVDSTFYNEIDVTYLYRVSAAHDPINQIVYWAYPGTGNTGGMPNKIVMYNYSSGATKRWAFAEIDTEILGRTTSEGYTLETLDNVSTSLDTLPFSLDSRVWTGNQPLLSAFDSDHKLANFNGDALTAVIDTTEAQIYPGRRANLLRVRPIVDGSGTVTVQVGQRNNLTETTAYQSVVSVNSTGNCPVRSNARYHRVRVTISGGFNDAQGIEVLESNPGGKR